MNYNLVMKQQINNLSNKPKLLLHVCCAPCSSGVLPKLQNFFDITLFYYNPNTFPEDEYLLRAKQFSKLTNLPLIICDYNHKDFLDTISGLENEQEGGKRCEKCINLRMEKSFEYAKLNNFKFVTTTLSVSPHKNAEFINKIGIELEKKYNTPYLRADFKKENGFLDSIVNSKKFDLYRQDFCGCEFSHLKNSNSSENN